MVDKQNKYLTQLAQFVIVCVIWGITWIPIKIAISHVPPTLLACFRGILAGVMILLGCRLFGIRLEIRLRDWSRLLLVSFLCYAATYSLLFWGALFVDSGTAAVIHFSLTPIFLFVFGVSMGEEGFAWRKVVSTFVGVLGLVLLYAAQLKSPSSSNAAMGMLALVGSTVVYTFGLVLSRQLLRLYSPSLIAGWLQVIGGLMLLIWSAFSAELNGTNINALLQPAVLSSFIFLVVFASIIASTLYLRLAKEWSPQQIGTQAFISPCIAVAAGVLWMNEQVRPAEFLGMSLMVLATVVGIWEMRSQTQKEDERDQLSKSAERECTAR